MPSEKKETKYDLHHSEDRSDTDISGPIIQDAVTQPGVVNPLQALTPTQLSADVDDFIAEYGLTEHREIFQKGALVARHANGTETLGALNDEEKEALIYETNHKWAGSFALYFTVFICATGAATQGWDQTGSNGANLSFPQEFGIGAQYGEPNGERDEWFVGLVNSGPYLAAGLIGCWLSDPLNHYFGRRGEIFITGILLIATPIASAVTQSWWQLFIVRLIMGVAFGAKNATVPVFSAEVAPTRIRGALVMGWQLWVCFGIFLGFAANVVVKDIPRIAWRLQLGSAFIPAVPLVLGIYFCPESPKWLMKKGRYSEAFNSYRKLRKHPIQAARDMYYSHVLFMEEKAMAAGTTYWSRNVNCWKVPRLRRSSLAACTVMLAQQLCGINIISFYSSTIFRQSGYTVDQSLYASLGFGAVNFVFAIPALWLIDGFGRRSLLLSTFPLMITFLVITGCCFLIPESAGDGRLGAIATFIYLFTASYSVGEGPCAFAYSAEVADTVHREAAMSQAVSVNNFFAGVLGLTFPSLLRAMGQTGAFCFYAGLSALGMFLIWLFVRESRLLSLEELDQVFAVPTGTYIKYQIKIIKRFIARDKTPLEPLMGTHCVEKTVYP